MKWLIKCTNCKLSNQTGATSFIQNFRQLMQIINKNILHGPDKFYITLMKEEKLLSKTPLNSLFMHTFNNIVVEYFLKISTVHEHG